MKKNQAFTLIELLVVIAIIGILSAVVLASLNTARAKGADANIKANLNGIRSQSALYYDTASASYGSAAYAVASCPDITNTSASTVSVFHDPNVKAAIAQAATQAGGVVSGATTTLVISKSSCQSSLTAGYDGWAAAVVLKSLNTNAWCVDSSGNAKVETITADTPAGAYNVATGTAPPTCK